MPSFFSKHDIKQVVIDTCCGLQHDHEKKGLVPCSRKTVRSTWNIYCSAKCETFLLKRLGDQNFYTVEYIGRIFNTNPDCIVFKPFFEDKVLFPLRLLASARSKLSLCLEKKDGARIAVTDVQKALEELDQNIALLMSALSGKFREIATRNNTLDSWNELKYDSPVLQRCDCGVCLRIKANIAKADSGDTSLGEVTPLNDKPHPNSDSDSECSLTPDLSPKSPTLKPFKNIFKEEPAEAETEQTLSTEKLILETIKIAEELKKGKLVNDLVDKIRQSLKPQDGDKLTNLNVACNLVTDINRKVKASRDYTESLTACYAPILRIIHNTYVKGGVSEDVKDKLLGFFAQAGKHS